MVTTGRGGAMKSLGGRAEVSETGGVARLFVGRGTTHVGPSDAKPSPLFQFLQERT